MEAYGDLRFEITFSRIPTGINKPKTNNGRYRVVSNNEYPTAISPKAVKVKRMREVTFDTPSGGNGGSP